MTMDPSNSDIKVEDKDADRAVTPIEIPENISKIFGDDFGKFDESFSFDSDDSDFEEKYTCELCETKFSGLKPMRQHQRSRRHLRNRKRTKLQKELGDKLSDEDASGSFFDYKVYAECKDCKKEFSGIEPYQQHMKSKGHKKKMASKKLKDQAKEDGKINIEKLKQLIVQEEKPDLLRGATYDSEDDDLDEDDLKCSDCDKVFTGLESFYDHIRSKKHKKILKQKELISKLTTGTTSGNNSGIEVDEEDIVCKLCKCSFTGPENVSAHLKSKAHAKMLEKHLWSRTQKEKESANKNQERISEIKGETEEEDEMIQVSHESKEGLQEIRENT